MLPDHNDDNNLNKQEIRAILICFIGLLVGDRRQRIQDLINLTSSLSAQQRTVLYTATDGQSASSSWCRAPFGADDQLLNFFKLQLLFCFLM
jgi:hypothetical protein